MRFSKIKDIGKVTSFIKSLPDQKNSSNRFDGISESDELNNQLFTDAIATKCFESFMELLESRRETSKKLSETEEQLNDFEEQVRNLHNEKTFLLGKIETQDKEIDRIKVQFSNSRTENEQLTEEYQDFREESQSKYQQLQNVLREQELANRQLMIDLNRMRSENQHKIEELEIKLRDERTKNTHLQEQYNKVVKENANLVDTINDFAQRAAAFSHFPLTNQQSSVERQINPVSLEDPNSTKSS